MKLDIKVKSHGGGSARAAKSPSAAETATRSLEDYTERAIKIADALLDESSEDGRMDICGDYFYQTGEHEDLIEQYLERYLRDAHDPSKLFKQKEARNVLLAIADEISSEHPETRREIEKIVLHARKQLKNQNK